MSEPVLKNKVLNGNQLKLIAIVAMTIDHLTWVFFPGCQHVWWVWCLHIIGRLTAPIMWFFIAEGCSFTRNPKKYFLRLLAFAVVSHFAYNFAFGIPFFDLSAGAFNRTSVLWPLALSVPVIYAVNSPKVKTLLKYVIIFSACVLAFPSDWSSIAVMCPLFLYSHRGNFKKQAIDIVFWSFVYALVYFIFLDKLYGILQLFTFLTIPLLSQYNGERGKFKGMKWFFYLYYPAHLVVIGIIRLALYGNISIIF